MFKPACRDYLFAGLLYQSILVLAQCTCYKGNMFSLFWCLLLGSNFGVSQESTLYNFHLSLEKWIIVCMFHPTTHVGSIFPTLKMTQNNRQGIVGVLLKQTIHYLQRTGPRQRTGHLTSQLLIERTDHPFMQRTEEVQKIITGNWRMCFI